MTLTERLKEQGVPPMGVMQFAIGVVIGAVFHDRKEWT